MNLLIPVASKSRFTDHDISDQLDRIFLHPDFSRSEILRKFLSYIVQEALTGNANCLKEYTIAVKVLEKPVNFNPQKNCIVRIHAGRLRHALSHYYNDNGTEDQIIIRIPKGKYVPTFMDRQQWLNEKHYNRTAMESEVTLPSFDTAIFAVLPFICASENETVRAFSENLCLQITSSLSQVKRISVIAYQAVKNLASRYSDLKEFGSAVGFNHIITRGTQHIKDKVRINIQIINCNSYKQIWSKIFECSLTASNLFDIQDEICQYTVAQAKALTEATA